MLHIYVRRTTTVSKESGYIYYLNRVATITARSVNMYDIYKKRNANVGKHVWRIDIPVKL